MSLWILKLSSCSSNAGMETSAPLINAIVTPCHATPTHASNRCRLTSCTFCGRLASQDFAMKCIEARAVRWPEVWKFYGSLTLLHFLTGEANGAQNVSVDTAHGKNNDHQIYKKMIMWYCRVYNQMSEDTIILFISWWRTTNKLQLVLINVLIRSIFEVLQGSVSMRLTCDGIFNDPFITQSLLSPKVKNFENRSTFAEVMGN